jgi:putative acetyltransferase
MTGFQRPEIHVRRYEPTDLRAVVELLRASVRRIARRDYSEEQVLAWAPDEVDWEARARRHSSRPTWVAEIGGAVAGFADLEPDGHVDFMYVHPEHQRVGVASALWRTIEAAARDLRVPRLFAEVSITARPFFEAQGFRLVAEQTVQRRGEALTNYRMEKLLEPGPSAAGPAGPDPGG